MNKIGECNSFRELSQELNGPANAWHLISVTFADLVGALEYYANGGTGTGVAKTVLLETGIEPEENK
jgi:hypothetical protein